MLLTVPDSGSLIARALEVRLAPVMLSHHLVVLERIGSDSAAAIVRLRRVCETVASAVGTQVVHGCLHLRVVPGAGCCTLRGVVLTGRLHCSR
jgi:hypothetical protein